MSLAPLQTEMRNQQTMCQILCDLLNLENTKKLESTIKKISNKPNKDEQTLTDIKNFNNIVSGQVKLFDYTTYEKYGNPQTEDGGYKNYILSVIQSYMFINNIQPLPPETMMLMVYYVYNYLLFKIDVTKGQNQENIQLIIDNILACKNNTSLTVEPPVSKLLGDFLEKSANIGPLGQKVLPIYFIGEESFGDDFGIFYLKDTSGKITKITFKQEQKKALAQLITQHDKVNISLFLAILFGYEMYPDTEMPIETPMETETKIDDDKDLEASLDSEDFEIETPFEKDLKNLINEFKDANTDAIAYDASKQTDPAVKEYRDLIFLLTDRFEPMIDERSNKVIGASYSFDIKPPVSVPFPILKEIKTSVQKFEENYQILDNVNEIPLYFICQVGEAAHHIVTILYIDGKVYSFGYGYSGPSDRQQKEEKIADSLKWYQEFHTGNGSIYTADHLLNIGVGYKYPLIDFGILTSEHVSKIEKFLNKTDTLSITFELDFKSETEFNYFSTRATENLISSRNCFINKDTHEVDLELLDHVLKCADVEHTTALTGDNFPTYFEICQQVSDISEKTKNYNCTSFVGAIFEHIECRIIFFDIVHPKFCHNTYIPSERDMLKWFNLFTSSYNYHDGKEAYPKVLKLLMDKQNIDKNGLKIDPYSLEAFSGISGPVRKESVLGKRPNDNFPNYGNVKKRGGKTKNRKTKNRKTRKIKRRVTRNKKQNKHSKNKTKKNRK